MKLTILCLKWVFFGNLFLLDFSFFLNNWMCCPVWAPPHFVRASWQKGQHFLKGMKRGYLMVCVTTNLPTLTLPLNPAIVRLGCRFTKCSRNCVHAEDCALHPHTLNYWVRLDQESHQVNPSLASVFIYIVYLTKTIHNTVIAPAVYTCLHVLMLVNSGRFYDTHKWGQWWINITNTYYIWPQKHTPTLFNDSEHWLLGSPPVLHLEIWGFCLSYLTIHTWWLQVG